MTGYEVHEEGQFRFTSMPKQVGEGVWRVDVIFEYKDGAADGAPAQRKKHTLSTDFDDAEAALEAGVDYGYERARDNRTGL
jgi:hypothetical protein